MVDFVHVWFCIYNFVASANRRKLVDFTAEGLTAEFPDGMTVDTDGNLWVASFNGAKVNIRCRSYSGKLLWND